MQALLLRHVRLSTARSFSAAPALCARPRKTVSLETSQDGPLHDKSTKKATKKAKEPALRTKVLNAREALSETARAALVPSARADNLFVGSYIAEHKGDGRPATELLAAAQKAWAGASDSEKQKFVEEAEADNEERRVAFMNLTAEDKTALLSLTKLVNRHRAELTAKDGKSRPKMHTPKDTQAQSPGPQTPWTRFVVEQFQSDDIKSLSPQERFKEIARKWQAQKKSS